MNLPLASKTGLKGFHGLDLVAEFEHGVRQCPGLNVRGPGNQRGSIPESDRLAVPLRDLLDMFLADQDLTEEVGRGPGKELDVPRAHRELEIPSLRGLGPPAHKTFGITEGGFPLRGVIHGTRGN